MQGRQYGKEIGGVLTHTELVAQSSRGPPKSESPRTVQVGTGLLLSSSQYIVLLFRVPWEAPGARMETALILSNPRLSCTLRS